MGYVKQESDRNFWKPEEDGNVIEGEVIVIDDSGEFGKQYHIKNSDDVVIVTPAHKVLQSRMIKAVIGTKVKIEFTGEELPKIKGNNPTRMYNVYFDEE